MGKYERELAALKASLRSKVCAVRKANNYVEALWKLSLGATHPDGKRMFTEHEKKALADASYSLRSVVGGWVNHKRPR